MCCRCNNRLRIADPDDFAGWDTARALRFLNWCVAVCCACAGALLGFVLWHVSQLV